MTQDNPWHQLMTNVNMSKNRRTPGMQNKPGNQKKIITIDEYYLESLFKEQEGRCYWTGYLIDPMDIFIPWSPLAMSVDRLENKGYIKGNVVICIRQENLGRNNASIEQWIEVKRKLYEHYKQMDTDSFEERQKKHKKLCESLSTSTFYDIFE